MNYFDVIEECEVSESELGFKITSLSQKEGFALRKLDSPIKENAVFELRYQISLAPDSRNACFAFGESPKNENLIKIGSIPRLGYNIIFEGLWGEKKSDTKEIIKLSPLEMRKPMEVVIKVDLKKKLVEAFINNKEIIHQFTENIKTINYVGFYLKNTTAQFSPVEIRTDRQTKIIRNGKFKPLMCVITKNQKSKIKQRLNLIEKQMKKSDWGLLVADLGSEDSTFNIIKKHSSSAKVFYYFQFKDHTVQEAKEKLSTLSEIYSSHFSSVNFEVLIDGGLEDHSHKIESFCTVATEEVMIEAAILIKSLRKFHDQPIYITCDPKTKHFLELEGFRNLHFDTSADRTNLKPVKQVTKANAFHRPECILKKMDAMNLALEENDNTFFLDCDVIVLDSLQENFTKDIVLSPNYYEPRYPKEPLKYGFFNAGYIFCADKTFPDYWRNLFLERSTFFEQQGMNYILEDYDIQIFSEGHNYGFWRSPSRKGINAKMKSFHVHLSDIDFKGESSFQEKNEKTKKVFFNYLNGTDHDDLKEYINNVREKNWGGTDMNFLIRKSNPKGKINLSSQPIFTSHRSGWAHVVESLGSLHNEDGILFDGFLEKNFSWNYEKNKIEKIIPYNNPWVGFLHNPPDIPKWFFYENSPKKMMARPAFQKSLDNCVGLFALSEYHADFLRETTGKLVSSFIHPTEIPDKLFDFESYQRNENKKIVNIGYWLRKLNSIYSLPLEHKDKIQKVRLIPYTATSPKEAINNLIEKEKKIYNIKVHPKYHNNTISSERLSDKEYDILLSENIAFLDLYDSSANNAVIECMARGTPILVNPLPAVKEYLGEGYPFYFESLEEAAEKAKNLELVHFTHEYLMSLETRKKLSQEYFKKDFEDSEVYKLISGGDKVNLLTKLKNIYNDYFIKKE